MDLSNENVIHIKDHGTEYIQFRKLLAYKEIINHAYSLGVDVDYMTEKPNKDKLEERQYQIVINNYRNLCETIGSNYINLVKANQEHTDEIKIVTKKFNNQKPDIHVDYYSKTDGLISNKEKFLLCTTNADCILLLFFDPIKKVIANTHSGWKGTLQRISVKTIRKMKEEFNCNAEDILVCICPSIRKCHFEVEKDVKDQFEQEFQDIENLKDIIEEVRPNQKWNIDTVKINQILLQREGLKPENIIDSKICSVCHSETIHSYRVEKQGYGLNTAIIELK